MFNVDMFPPSLLTHVPEHTPYGVEMVLGGYTSFQADNTAREHKNQNLVIYSGWLVVTGRAESVSNQFFEVGHTHNGVDQRFSVIGGHLVRHDCLETPADFLKVIQAIKPVAKRRVITERLEGVHDWKEFFSPLGMNISGITTNKNDPVVNHVWRTVRRGDLDDYNKVGTWAIETPEVHSKINEPHGHMFDISHRRNQAWFGFVYQSVLQYVYSDVFGPRFKRDVRGECRGSYASLVNHRPSNPSESGDPHSPSTAACKPHAFNANRIQRHDC